MTKIQKIELFDIKLPLLGGFKSSQAMMHEKQAIVLKLSNAKGESIWSECVALPTPHYMPEILDTAWIMMRDWVAPAVVGKSFDHPTQVAPLLDRLINGHSMAKAAIEMGIWAMAALEHQQSLARFLGGNTAEVESGVVIGVQSNELALLQKVEAALGEGYKKIKIKIAPGYDDVPLKAIRNEFGNSISLAVDANSAYSLTDIEQLKRLDQWRLMMIEQPFSVHRTRDHAQLVTELETPICLDESIQTIEDAHSMITDQTGAIINIKAGRVGGFRSALAIRDICQDNGIPVWCGGMLETGIGRAYNVALASCSNFILPGDISASNRYFEHDIVSPAWQLNPSGQIDVPLDSVGLGVTVDEARIRELAVRDISIQSD